MGDTVSEVIGHLSDEVKNLKIRQQNFEEEVRHAAEVEMKKMQDLQFQQEWNDEDNQRDCRRLQKTVDKQQDTVAQLGSFVQNLLVEFKRMREEDNAFKNELLRELGYLRDDVIEWKRQLDNRSVRFKAQPQVFTFDDYSGNVTDHSMWSHQPLKTSTPMPPAIKNFENYGALANIQNSLNNLEEGVPAFHDELAKIHDKVDELTFKVESIEQFQQGVFDEAKSQLDQMRNEQKKKMQEIQMNQRDEFDSLRVDWTNARRNYNDETGYVAPSENRENIPPPNQAYNSPSRPEAPPRFLKDFPKIVYQLFPDYYADPILRQNCLNCINSSKTQDEIETRVLELYELPKK
ncbi:hypothetical protein L5515_015176 [Caenorhabditis briggsae]|uniref:Uncharacterized protein n=1 Tax=Caenorhabditis briggsae TaxID=6238 RepID=A0AAE9EDF6_CAEBR|nr:hypothetical protein L5515_015176 [Caenorhabditis briggsae]